jgi:hypothetical protein
MKDGKTKPIGEIEPGDEVEAADPASGKHAGPHTVTATWVNHDTDLVDVTVRGLDGKPRTLHTTADHPFWDDTSHTWTPADALHPGDQLNTDRDRHVTVLSTRVTPGAANRDNLTVAELHTYYVLAGATPVLVHNTCGPSGPDPDGNIVYRALAHGEDHSVGLTARDPSNAGVSPLSHVAGKKMTPWISTSKDPTIAFGKYNQGNGVVAIDLRRMPFSYTDISDGPFPSSPRHSAYARKDSEVLIWQHVPADAIVGFWS